MILKILLTVKRRHYIHRLFQSFWYSLKHFVQINTDVSTFLHSLFGVLQGSILGPILFNLCVADRSGTVNSCECLRYADDTMIYHYCKVKDIRQTENHFIDRSHCLIYWNSYKKQIPSLIHQKLNWWLLESNEWQKCMIWKTN